MLQASEPTSRDYRKGWRRPTPVLDRPRAEAYRAHAAAQTNRGLAEPRRRGLVGEPWVPLRLRQIEVQSVEKLDGGIRGVDCNVLRHVEESLGVVEDDPDAGFDEIVRDALRVVRRDGDDSHDDVLFPDCVGEPRVVADRHVADGPADLVGVGVEDCRDVDSVLGEDRRARDCLPETPRPDQGDVVLPLCAEDLSNLSEQRVDVVADAALAELPERGEVAPDLRGVDVGVVRDLLRGDAVLAHLLGLLPHLAITGEPRCDSARLAYGN